MIEYEKSGQLVSSSSGDYFLMIDGVLWDAIPSREHLLKLIVDNNIRYGDNVRITLRVEKI